MLSSASLPFSATATGTAQLEHAEAPVIQSDRPSLLPVEKRLLFFPLLLHLTRTSNFKALSRITIASLTSLSHFWSHRYLILDTQTVCHLTIWRPARKKLPGRPCIQTNPVSVLCGRVFLLEPSTDRKDPPLSYGAHTPLQYPSVNRKEKGKGKEKEETN